MRAALHPPITTHETAAAGFASRWFFVNSAFGSIRSEIKLNRRLQARGVITGTTDDFTPTIDQLGPDGHPFGRFVKQTEVGRRNVVGIGHGKGDVDLVLPQRQSCRLHGADGLVEDKGGTDGLDGHRNFLCCEWRIIAKIATLTRARARCGAIKTGAGKAQNILGKAS